MNKNNIILWSLFSIAIVGIVIIAIVVGQKQSYPNQSGPKEEKASVLTVKENDHQTNTEGIVTIIEYSDFQCPACGFYAPILKETASKYEKEVNFVYRHFPLRSIHPNAQIAAQASEAAAIQGKFFEMHDMLFEKQEEWSIRPNPKKYFIEYAKQLEMDPVKFKKDMSSKEVRTIVNASYLSAFKDLELRSTPSVFINGQLLASGLSAENLEAYIDQAIKDYSIETEKISIEEATDLNQ